VRGAPTAHPCRKVASTFGPCGVVTERGVRDARTPETPRESAASHHGLRVHFEESRKTSTQMFRTVAIPRGGEGPAVPALRLLGRSARRRPVRTGLNAEPPGTGRRIAGAGAPPEAPGGRRAPQPPRRPLADPKHPRPSRSARSAVLRPPRRRGVRVTPSPCSRELGPAASGGWKTRFALGWGARLAPGCAASVRYSRGNRGRRPVDRRLRGL
jgi:hypothetical protein